MVHLLVRFEGVEEKFSLDQDVVTLGRTSANTIQVKDSKASRNHCELRKGTDGWRMVDLESSNGTSLNGTKVNASALKSGDIVSIGAFEVVFEPVAAVAPVALPKPVEPTEKTVVEESPRLAHVKPVPAEVQSRKMIGYAKAGAIAAAVLIGGTIIVNKVRTAMFAEDSHRNALNAALRLAKDGKLQDAVAAFDAIIVSNAPQEFSRRASEERGKLKAQIASRDAELAKRREADMAEIFATQKSASAANRYEEVVSQVASYLTAGDFAGAMDEIRRFRMEFPDGEWSTKIATSARKVFDAADEAWEELQAQANDLTRNEKYAEATALLAEAQSRFQGTRFAFDIVSKVAAIQRLSGVTAAYAAGGAELSAAAQESMLAVGDLVRARKYDEALKAFDKLVSSVPEKDRASFGGRRSDIAGQGAIFRKLLAAINAGEMASYEIQLAGGVKGKLSQATEVAVTMDFKDLYGKGGTTGRRWFQVPGADMLGYYRAMTLSATDLLSLAAFCYDNRLPLDGAEILNDLAKKNESLIAEVFGLVARVRGIGVPADGFVYFERGWYTKLEYTYAKLDYRAKKGAQLIAKIDVKPAAEGYSIYKELAGDSSLTPEFRATATGYFVKELRSKRQAIMRSLKESPAVANFQALKAVKADLNLKRAEALRIIYDKEIYPDENHGVAGQPKVDEAVEKVKELWDKPLRTVVLDVGVKILVEAGQQTNEWLKEMGEAANEEDLEEFENLLVVIGEKLHLRNVCLDSRERKILEYNRKVWQYNKDNDSGMSGFEIDCIRITNEYREMQGREILQHDEQLGKTAEGHSAEMVEMGYFAHESPITTRKTPMDRAKLEGYPGSVGENIATGYGSPQAAFDGWYNSSGHHRNMLSDGWNHIGIGCIGGTMWTENLGRGTSHLGKDKNDKKGAEKQPENKRRGGLDEGGEEGKKEGDKTERKDDAKAGARAGERGAAPATPDGKCTGTEPYNPDKDKPQGQKPDEDGKENPK